MTIEPANLFDEPSKVWIHFGSPAGEIDGRDVGLFEDAKGRVHRLLRHDFGAVGPGIDMAVTAGLVTQFAQVELEDGDCGGGKRRSSALGQSPIKGGKVPTGAQSLSLGRRIGEW